MDNHRDLEKQQPDIKFNIDDFDLENYDFEPITEGLGFNNEIKKKDNRIVKTKTTTKPAPVLRREDFEQKEQEFRGEGLSSFYQDSKLTTVKSPARVKTEKVDFKPALTEAPLELRFGSWIIDLLTVVAMFAGTIAICATLVSLPLSERTLSMLGMEAYLYMGIIFSCYYLFYFTLFDLQTTVGKYLLGIKTYSSSDQEMTLKQSFIRSLTGLLSLILFGFPLLFDFQGKLSDTKVCMN